MGNGGGHQQGLSMSRVHAGERAACRLAVAACLLVALAVAPAAAQQNTTAGTRTAYALHQM